jgi:predicted nucleotidyltransferase
MLSKKSGILYVFAEAPWRKFTFREVKRLSGKKSESYVYNSLKEFVRNGILVENLAGNVILYSLNLTSMKALSCAGFTAEHAGWSRKNLPYTDLERITLKTPTAFYTLLVTGSYAKNTQKKGSDLDLVLICDDCAEPKKIYAELRQDCELNIPPIHLYVFKKKEFLAMLFDGKANYGKETVKNNLILSGGKEYYAIMAEAVRHGFNG